MGRVVGWVDGASTVYSRAKLIAGRVPHTEPIGRTEAALGRGSCPSAGTAPDAALDARREARAAPSGSGSWLGGRSVDRLQQSEVDRGSGAPHRAYRAHRSGSWAGELPLRWDGPGRRLRRAERGQSGA